MYPEHVVKGIIKTMIVDTLRHIGVQAKGILVRHFQMSTVPFVQYRLFALIQIVYHVCQVIIVQINLHIFIDAKQHALPVLILTVGLAMAAKIVLAHRAQPISGAGMKSRTIAQNQVKIRI